MDRSKNDEYNRQAISMLHNQLYDVPWIIDERTKDINKMKLLDMFNDSCRIKRDNNNELYSLADAVFYSCVRAVRCLCMEDKEAKILLLQEKEYTLDALSQYENAIRNYEILKEKL